jgi:hypothetical protein
MKNIKFKIGFFILVIVIISSCQPRIELDMTQWGNNAYITNVQLFKLEIRDDFQLSEWYTDDGQIPVTGVRRLITSQGNAVVDDENFSVTVQLRNGENIRETGLMIYHYGTLVEPLFGAPQPGIINDLSEGLFTYRIHSADGNYNDWIINIVQ